MVTTTVERPQQRDDVADPVELTADLPFGLVFEERFVRLDDSDGLSWIGPDGAVAIVSPVATVPVMNQTVDVFDTSTLFGLDHQLDNSFD